MNNEDSKINGLENTQSENEEPMADNEGLYEENPNVTTADEIETDGVENITGNEVLPKEAETGEKTQANESGNDNFVSEEEYLIEEVNKENRRMNTSLKIAAGILVAFAAVFAVFMLVFNPTPEKALKNSGLLGDWINRTGDIVAFYSFEEDGKLTLTTGTLENISGFAIDPDTDKTFYVYTYGEDPEQTKTGSLQYDIYKEDGVETLKIYSENTEGSEFYLQRSKLPDDLLKPDESFKYDEALCGEWHNDEKDLLLKFGKDGLITLDFSAVVYNGTYTAKDGKVDFTYYNSFSEDSKATETFYYQLEGDKLKFYTAQPSDDAQAVEFVKTENEGE
ncbi:MAG: hypothetical protein K6F76_05310 [Clostridiales bacterium]|nr:hypothetical protein [Clostridiales bacterium]